MPWVCGNYEKRPEACKKYPQADSYQPDSCGYFFPGNGTREGRCEEECEGTCCRLPRKDGEPGGAALPEVAGGEPCKYLEYVDKKVKFAPDKTENVAGDIRDAPARPEEE